MFKKKQRYAHYKSQKGCFFCITAVKGVYLKKSSKCKIVYIYIWAWGSSNKLGTLLDSAVVPRVVINQSLTLRRTDLLHKSATICFTFTKTFQIPVQHFYPRNPQAAKKEHSKNPICFQQIHGYTMNLSYCDAKNSSLESPQKNFRASLENRKGWMGR